VTTPERSCYPEYQIADPQRQARRLAAAMASRPTTANTRLGSPEPRWAMEGEELREIEAVAAEERSGGTGSLRRGRSAARWLLEWRARDASVRPLGGRPATAS